MKLLRDHPRALASENFERCSLHSFGGEDQRFGMHHRGEDGNQDAFASDVMINSDIAAASILDLPNIRNEMFGHRVGLQHFQAIGLKKGTAHHVPQVLLVEPDRDTSLFRTPLDFHRSSHESSRRCILSHNKTKNLSHSALHQSARVDNFQHRARGLA